LIFDDPLLDDLDDELSEKDINLQLASKIMLCHIKNIEQGVTHGGKKKYKTER